MDQVCCRLCMQEHPKMIPIFSNYRSFLISDLIKRFIPELYLDKNENLSTVVCRSCFDILAKIEELRRSSIDNDRIQRSVIEDKKFVDVKVEIVDEEYFEPICNTYTNEDNCSTKYEPHDQLPDDSERRKTARASKHPRERTKESRQEPADKRTCEICGKVFARRDSLLIHAAKQHNSIRGGYSCDICDEPKLFKIRARLEEHMMAVHLNTLNDEAFKYFECEQCKISFMNIEDFTSHSFYVHGRECGKVRAIKRSDFETNEKSLKFHHMNTVHKSNSTYYCDLCANTSFSMKARLHEHMMVVHMGTCNSVSDKLKFYECKNCFDSYINFDELQIHSLFVHDKPLYRRDSSKKLYKKNNRRSVTTSDLGSYSCELCPESFVKEYRLIDHRLKVHHTGFKCIKCNINFDTKKDLQFHNNIHVDFVRKLSDTEIEMKYECILCAFKSFQENELYQHLPSHVNEFALNTTGKLLVCNNCSTILKDYDSLHSHVGVHNELITHECLKCNKKFPMGNRLLRHLMKHKMNEKLKCTYRNCNYSCPTKPQMKDHIRHKHLDEVVHLCSICGQSFGQPGSLRNHIKNIHDKSGHIYQCNMCPMTFRVPSHLRNHQAVHTTEFNFKCEHAGCTKAFRAKRNLQLHLRFHDRSQLNYKYPCNFCERKFLTRDAVKRHTYSHTKVKPYVCTFSGCDRAFSQSNDLNKHLRSHYQQEETYFCSYINCKQSFRLKSELRYHEGLHYRNQDPVPKEDH